MVLAFLSDGYSSCNIFGNISGQALSSHPGSDYTPMGRRPSSEAGATVVSPSGFATWGSSAQAQVFVNALKGVQIGKTYIPTLILTIEQKLSKEMKDKLSLDIVKQKPSPDQKPEFVLQYLADEKSAAKLRGANYTKPQSSSKKEESDDESEEEIKNPLDFVRNPEEIRQEAERKRQEQYRIRRGNNPNPNRDVVGQSKGQGQQKQVLINRQHKTENKGKKEERNLG